MDERKHSIQKGDWIIRDPEDPPAINQFQFPPMMTADFTDYVSFSDHAVFVLDSTQGHLTIYSPILGRPAIIVFDRFPGRWRYATCQQVETTWDLALMARRDHGMQIKMEKDKFPWRPMAKREGEQAR